MASGEVQVRQHFRTATNHNSPTHDGHKIDYKEAQSSSNSPILAEGELSKRCILPQDQLAPDWYCKPVTSKKLEEQQFQDYQESTRDKDNQDTVRCDRQQVRKLSEPACPDEGENSAQVNNKHYGGSVMGIFFKVWSLVKGKYSFIGLR